MEQVAAGDVDSVADLLSVHFYEGGDLERAWRYARLAGANAQAAYANTDAAALYRRALEAARRLRERRARRGARATWTALGDVLEQAGLPDEAHGRLPPRHGPRRRRPRRAGPDPAQAGAGSASVPGRFVAALGSCAPPSGLWPEDPSDGAERVRVAAATHAGHHPRGPGAAPPSPCVPPSEPRPRPSSVGELRELAKALNVIDWAHVSLGDLDQAAHHRGSSRSTETLGQPHRAAAALGQPRRASSTGTDGGTRRSTATGGRTTPTSRPATS